jgi:hypothetical protein
MIGVTSVGAPFIWIEVEFKFAFNARIFIFACRIGTLIPEVLLGEGKKIQDAGLAGRAGREGRESTAQHLERAKGRAGLRPAPTGNREEGAASCAASSKMTRGGRSALQSTSREARASGW